MSDEAQIQSFEITVSRTARYVVLGPQDSRVDTVWLVCHGYGQLASRFIRRFAGIADGTRLIVAPEAMSRFYVQASDRPHTPADRVGASWMTHEDRAGEIADQINYLESVREVMLAGLTGQRPRFVAFGFSQGAAVVCRWAARTRIPPDHIVVWGGTLPPELLTDDGGHSLGRASLTVVVGRDDPRVSHSLLESQRGQLAAAGIPCRFITYDGTHDVDANVLAKIAREIEGSQAS